MPYGVVMATAGAGGVAGLVGLHRLTLVLTGIAIVQAIAIALLAARTWRRPAAPRWRFGLFTIALGLAVIGANLQPVATYAAITAVALAWAATLVLGAWRLVLMHTPAGRHERVDGTWFLAPAALLGDASATAAVAGHAAAWSTLAIATCLVGIAGYAFVLGAAGWRVFRQRLAGSPLAPWWIAAGCGGLAAAAAHDVAMTVASARLVQVLNAATLATWVVGSVALIAVLAGCVAHAWRRAPAPWTRVWTPVFSMAVYADGTHAMASLDDAGWLYACGVAAIAATLMLWLVNSALWLRQLGPRRDPPAALPRER